MILRIDPVDTQEVLKELQLGPFFERLVIDDDHKLAAVFQEYGDSGGYSYPEVMDTSLIKMSNHPTMSLFEFLETTWAMPTEKLYKAVNKFCGLKIADMPLYMTGTFNYLPCEVEQLENGFLPCPLFEKPKAYTVPLPWQIAFSRWRLLINK